MQNVWRWYGDQSAGAVFSNATPGCRPAWCRPLHEPEALQREPGDVQPAGPGERALDEVTAAWVRARSGEAPTLTALPRALYVRRYDIHMGLCRHHHRCKQAEGWWLDQPEPGVWRTPSGRTYTTTRAEYPV
jgi:hypothetical protein